MKKQSFLVIALVAALAGFASVPAAAQKPVKIPKIKLEPLKPGKIKLDPRLGYILVRMGPNGADVKPVPVGFVRINATTGKGFEGEAEADVPDFGRTLSVAVNVGRSFGSSDGHAVYLLSAYPGRWVISNVGGTCLSLGSYSFDVKQGEVSDIGTLLTAREDGKAGVPELADAKLSQDLIDFGTMMNIVMSDAMFAAPAVDAPAMPAELAGFPVTKVALAPDFRSDNRCQGMINRAVSLPPMENLPPMTEAEALVAIQKINPPERVEAARKRAERRAAEAAAK